MVNKVLEVENVSKQYRLGKVGTGTLSHDLNRWWHIIRGKEDPYLKIGETNDRTKLGNSEYVWALQDINFSINQGEAVGFIGRNGAGKSTLLKLLSKVTKPTTGSIKYKGRIASLLEVGTGFHPELSGRENIYMNGAILGMTKKEISRKFDEIVDFSGVERYIDTPVKRYSSGMYVRLAFAVAAHLESEILIVDEVLAVGDAEFQKKCLGKMGDVSKGEGRTVLFVSHNLSAIRELCSRGIYMENGHIKYAGEVENCLYLYNGDNKFNSTWIGEVKNKFISIKKTSVYNEEQSQVIYNKDEIFISIELDVIEKLENLGIGFYIKSQYEDNLLRCFYNDYSDLKTLDNGKYKIIFKIPQYTLAEGKYTVLFDIAKPNVEEFSKGKCNISFEVVAHGKMGNVTLNSHLPKFGSIVRPNYLHSIDKY